MGSERREAGGASREVRTFAVRRRVLFSETDVAGIVHFSNYFRYFEDAEHALWREVGLCIHEKDSPIGWPRVAASCEYHRPLRFEQEFAINVHVAGMTKRVIHYEGAIVRDSERIATATWKIACVLKLPDGSMKSTDMPDDVADRLKPFTSRTSNLEPRASHLAPRTSDV
jgi:YbgC/YbaW family acyl-CoA thioester hydrolase